MDKNLTDPYWDAPVITRRQLNETIQSTVLRTIEELGLISKYIGRSEIVNQIGRAKYDYGVTMGLLHPIKKGFKNSKIDILRSEYEEYMSTTVLEDGTTKPIIIKKHNTNR